MKYVDASFAARSHRRPTLGIMSGGFHHITVPTDGSATAERGVDIALDLLVAEGTITFCSVVESAAVLMSAREITAFDPGPAGQMQEREALRFCERARTEALERGVKADVRVLHGQRIEAIDALVRQNGSDAIVIGTHGRTGVARGFLGSVTEGLLRRSDVPVISVHEHDDMQTGPIVVAIDDSRSSVAAVEAAIGIAKARDTSLVLIHVFGGHLDDDRTTRLLRTATDQARRRGVRSTSTLRAGAPSEEIVAVADEVAGSMIAIGTHGRGPVARLVLGSVAAAVVEHAHVPVVTIRRPGER